MNYTITKTQKAKEIFHNLVLFAIMVFLPQSAKTAVIAIVYFLVLLYVYAFHKKASDTFYALLMINMFLAAFYIEGLDG